MAYALGRTAGGPGTTPRRGQAPEPAQGNVDGLGRPSRHATAKRTEARGLTFPSKLEAAVIEELWRRADEDPAGRRRMILRQPRFDLWASWTPGMGKPLAFTPDALELTPRDVEALELEAAEDPVQGKTVGVSSPAWLELWDLTVHEAKTRRGLESRDYVPRLAAFRATYPRARVVVWRRERGQLVAEDLADLGFGIDGPP